MSRVKCVECGKLAHLVTGSKAYCDKCAPKPTMPVTVEETLVNEVIIEKMERPKPWSEPPTEKEPWWKRIFRF